jgi:voltage-gated potassium channel
MTNPFDQKPAAGWRRRVYEVVFESNTWSGRWFDLILIWAILASAAAVVLESVASIRGRYGAALTAVEWGFTLLFTVEYVTRLISVRRPVRYAGSWLGVIDLLAIAPTYLSLLVPGTQALVVVRALRVLRIFRVLKLTAYLQESRVLVDALWAGRRKIGVFLLAVLTLLVVIGSVMYLVEGEENGFTDIPTSVYWAVVTLTTVGYGDIAPRTSLGRVLSAVVMILGYTIIAVPTGIVTAELSRAGRGPAGRPVCPRCGIGGHDSDAGFCKHCGTRLTVATADGEPARPAATL